MTVRLQAIKYYNILFGTGSHLVTHLVFAQIIYRIVAWHFANQNTLQEIQNQCSLLLLLLLLLSH